MLGFTVKSYLVGNKLWIHSHTGDNLVMWQDIEQGKIAPTQTKLFQFIKKYKRSNLTSLFH